MNFTSRTGRPANVLLAEDNEADQRTVQRGLSKARLPMRLFLVEDGEACLDFLRHQGQYADTTAFPRPDLLLLDINMPKLDGRAVLKQIRADPILVALPVVILTTSDQEQDILISYKNGANAFITKPVEPGRFMETVLKLEEFWFELAALPVSR
ncbi:MAG: response regulator [Magnetococcales bacterium]|nr:response regulator [Magnetococcales bacterium]